MNIFHKQSLKRTFKRRDYIICGQFIIEYAWHLSDLGYSYVLKEKTKRGWRKIASTYSDLHHDFQCAADYLFWYNDTKNAILK